MNKIDIYVINLKNRADRLKYIINHLKNIDFINVNVFEAIENNEGWIGCTLSHLSLINYADKNDLPYIIVLEDDFNLELDINEFELLLRKIITFNDVDVFNGVPGWSKLFEKYKFFSNNDFSLTKGVLSTAFMIYYKKSYKKFNNINFIKYPIDVINNIFFYQLIYNKQIGNQIPSYSSVSNNYSDHLLHYKIIYDLLKTMPFTEYEDYDNNLIYYFDKQNKLIN
jgi:GR25 family glycosyltransferase involved in LPS biosynthesis